MPGLAEQSHQTAVIDDMLRRVIVKAVLSQGVPVDVAGVYRLAEALYPLVRKARGAYYRSDLGFLGARMAEMGLEIAPADERAYTVRAVYSAVARAAGLTPVSVVAQGMEMLDAETAAVVRRELADRAVEPDRFAAGVSRALVRHGRQAGRDAIADTVHAGRVRVASTGRKFSGKVGYARVLSGRESCAFCAMLASRGAVYANDTVLFREDGRRYHDNCDCVAVPVVEGKSWEGQAEAEALYQVWRDVTWEDGQPGRSQWPKWKAFVNSGGIDLTKYSPLTPDEVPGSSVAKLVKTAVYARGEQTRRWASLDDVPKLSDSETMEAYMRSNPKHKTELDQRPEGMHEKPWNVNCVRCVSAAELRRRGYDVTAGPGSFKRPPDYTGGNNADYALELGWRNRETGEAPYFFAPTRYRASKARDEALVKYLNSSMPNGARGFATNSWYSDEVAYAKRWGLPLPPDPVTSGHILVWEKKGRRIVFHDPQTGEVNITPKKYWQRSRFVPGSLMATRIDDCDPIDGVLDVIGGDLDQWR